MKTRADGRVVVRLAKPHYLDGVRRRPGTTVALRPWAAEQLVRLGVGWINKKDRRQAGR